MGGKWVLGMLDPFVQEHTSTILEFSSLGPTLLEAPGSLHWAQPMQLPASRGPLRPQLEETVISLGVRPRLKS